MTTVQFVLDPRSDRFQIWRKIWYTRLENMRSSLLIFNQEDYNNKFYSSTLVYLLVYCLLFISRVGSRVVPVVPIFFVA